MRHVTLKKLFDSIQAVASQHEEAGGGQGSEVGRGGRRSLRGFTSDEASNTALGVAQYTSASPQQMVRLVYRSVSQIWFAGHGWLVSGTAPVRFQNRVS